MVSIGRRMEASNQLKQVNVSIAGFEILSLTSQEMDERLQVELASNPAFEYEVKETCPYCGSVMNLPYCNACQWDNRITRSADLGQLLLAGQKAASPIESESDADDLAVLSRGVTLEEQLLETMRCILSADDIPIAEALIGNLDKHGFLNEPVENIAFDLAVSPQHVEIVLKLLQQQDPIGIGARSAQECLLLQLNALRGYAPIPEYTEILIAEYLQQAKLGRFREIARVLNISVHRVKEGWEFILQHLNPVPTNSWIGETIESHQIISQDPLIRPDVIIYCNEKGQYEVEVVESRRMQLRIAEDYISIRQQSRLPMSPSEKEHIRYYVHRSEMFINNIRRRWQTMKRITETIVELQRPFLERGYHFLKPMTRNTIAMILNFEESTVSRAVRGRYVLLPSGEIMTFESFFDSSLPIKMIIQDLLKEEDPQHPFSDRHIAMLLNQKGVIIKRRTVAKYRNEMCINTSRQRPVT